MDFMHLIELVVPREKWTERKHFKENAPNAPVVHLVIIVPIGQQALRRPVPASGDVFSERRLRVNAAAGTEVG